MPQIADWMPEFSGITRDGKFEMKSQETTDRPSEEKSQMIAPRAMNVRASAPNIRPLKTRGGGLVLAP